MIDDDLDYLPVIIQQYFKISPENNVPVDNFRNFLLSKNVNITKRELAKTLLKLGITYKLIDRKRCFIGISLNE